MAISGILYLPIIEWSFRRQRPQQVARCFARAGYRVYYSFLRLRPEPPLPNLIESGIWQIAIRGDADRDPYRDRLSSQDVEDALASLRELAGNHPLEGCWIVAQLPFWRPLAERAREVFGGRLLFECMEDFSSFGDHADLRDEEVALARTADLVAVSSQALYDMISLLLTIHAAGSFATAVTPSTSARPSPVEGQAPGRWSVFLAAFTTGSTHRW